MGSNNQKWGKRKADRLQELAAKLTKLAEGHLPGILPIVANLYANKSVTEARGLAIQHFEEVVIASTLTREFHRIAKQSRHPATPQSGELLLVLNQLKRFIGREFLEPGTQPQRELISLRSTTRSRILDKIRL